MSHKKRKASPAGPSPHVQAARPSHPPVARGWRKVCLAGLVALAAVAVVLSFVRSRTPGLPSLSLDKADPNVARIVQKHLDAVRASPRSANAWGRLGIVLRAYDFKLEARRCLAIAENLDVRNPRWPYFQGLLLIIPSPDQAIAKFRRVVELCGNHPEAPRYRLARLLGEQSRWEEADAELDRLLSAQPDLAPALLTKAQGALARNRLDQAIALGRQCAGDPRTVRSAWALLATAYRKKGDLRAAADAAHRSITAPADEGLGDPFEGEAAMLRGDPRVLSEEAYPLLAGGRLEDARRLIDRLLNEYPNYPDTWLALGRWQLLTKDLPAAERSLRRHLELEPRSTQGLFQLGLILLQQQRFNEAAESFLEAAKLKPDFGQAFFNRGVALARAGQTSEAVAAFRESLRHNPEHLESYLLLADLYRQTGRRTDAEQLLDQARLLNPADPRLRKMDEKLRADPR